MKISMDLTQEKREVLRKMSKDFYEKNNFLLEMNLYCYCNKKKELNMKRAIDLTQKERKIFLKKFYEIEEFGLDDLDTSSPWGAPWEWRPTVNLEGNNAEEMAVNFYNGYRNQIEIDVSYEYEMQELD